jgi:hypothetical protein
MPRPTNAQVAYGSLTVVLFTIAMLLLTHARSTAAVAAVAAGGLVCGLLVVAAGAAAQSRRAAAPAATARSSAAPLTSLAPLPRARVRAGAERRVGEHSLRR